jgi:hypothetical protein
MEYQDFTLSRGTAPKLRFRLVDPQDVSTWETAFEVRLDDKDNSNTIFTAVGAIANLTEVPNAAALGVMDVALTKANTETFTIGHLYHYRFKRTNTGFEDVLTRGRMKVI